MLTVDEEVENGEDFDEDVEVTYEGVTDGMIVNCGGIITDIKKILVKSTNKPMAILTIEDLYGSFGTMLTPKVYEKYKDMLVEDKIVMINGKLSIRPGKEPIIMLERLTELKQEEVVDEEPKKTLYLKYNTKDIKLNDKINLVLNLYKGECPVVVRCTQDNKAYRNSKTVNGNNHLLNELIGLIGEENVILR